MKPIIVILGVLVLPCTRARYLMIRLADLLKAGKINDNSIDILSDTSKKDDHYYAHTDYEPLRESIYDQYSSGN